MTTLRLAVAAVLTGILMVSTGSLAHAATDPYPVKTPVPTQSVGPDDNGVGPDDDSLAPDDNAVAPDDDGILPSTGGVAFYLLIVGGALVVAGGGAVHLSRRRHATSH